MGKMMFRSVLTVVALLAAPVGALAYENYIPLGTGYAPNVDTLPELGTDLSNAIGQADIYETELYRVQRRQIEEESRLKSFFSDSGSTGSGDQIDY
jgi:hypothetical protein